MKDYTYTELRKYISDDINEFIADGLNIRQAISRVQVEYSQLMAQSDLAELIIHMVLSREVVVRGETRTDVTEKTLRCIESAGAKDFKKELDDRELQMLREEIQTTIELLTINNK